MYDKNKVLNEGSRARESRTRDSRKTKIIIRLLLCTILILSVSVFFCACGDKAEKEAKDITDSYDLSVGQDQTLDVDTSGGKVKWSSSDKKVAEVSKDGKIIAKGPGEATITVKSGDKEYTYNVKVNDSDGSAASSEGKSSDKDSDSGNAKKDKNKKSKESATSDKEKQSGSSKDKKDKKDSSGSKDSSKDSSGKSGSADADKNKQTRKERLEGKYAASSLPLIYPDAVSANAGDTNVAVPVFIYKNPGILGMTLTINYDDKALELKDIKNGNALKDVLDMTKAGKLEDGCRITWDGMELKQSDVKDGTIMTLYFDIKSKAKAGKYNIDLGYEYGDIVDERLLPVEANLEKGRIKVR